MLLGSDTVDLLYIHAIICLSSVILWLCPNTYSTEAKNLLKKETFFSFAATNIVTD